MVTDGDSFAVFVREHSRTLFGTAFVLTASAAAAEELLQDTLVRLYPKWHLVQAADSSVAYVRRALVNGYLSARRRPGNRYLHSDARAAGYAIDVADVVTDRRFLLDLLGGLPLRQRTAIVLHCLYDLPDAEIATILECRTATVRSLVSRGIATMRERHAHSRSATADGLGERR